MVTIEEAEQMLNEACEALPPEIFKDLNGGVNLLPELRREENGDVTLGLYHKDAMGRYVEIFYGSLDALYGQEPPEVFRAQLVRTLHHELTHHIEGLAGDRTLEHWDEEQRALRGLADEGVVLAANRILFVDEDDAALAPAVCAMFAALAAEAEPPITCASAGMTAGAAMLPEAVRAAAKRGADIGAHRPRQVDEALLREYEAVLCMTLRQADDLAERFPDMDEKFLCLGETDILPPGGKLGWNGAMKRLAAEAQYLLEELTAED